MSGLSISQLKHLIIAPTLGAVGLGGDAAVNLLAGTALAESGAAYVRQIGGPALGLWQMEPATHQDCWDNYLAFPGRSTLARGIRGLLSADVPSEDQLMCNLRYACVMARVKYLRVPHPLPGASDAVALAAYHKKWYNSECGAANAARNVPLFAAAIAA